MNIYHNYFVVRVDGKVEAACVDDRTQRTAEEVTEWVRQKYTVEYISGRDVLDITIGQPLQFKSGVK